MVRGGESEEAFDLGLRSSRAYAEKHYPKAAQKLYKPRSCMSDFTGGCRLAYQSNFGAKTPDNYMFANGIGRPTQSPLLKGCSLHAIRDATDTAHAGYGYLADASVANVSKSDAASTLAYRMRFMGRRLTLVLFDLFCEYTKLELPRGTIPGAGVQTSWFPDYFEKYKLFKETAHGCELYNATWRSGPDRRIGVGDTNNLSESKNKELRDKMAQIV